MRILALLVCTALAVAGESPRFKDVQIEKPYAAYLQANPLLMEVAGAKVLRLPSGKQLVLGVGSTVLKDSSARERLRAETVARVKAIAAIAAEKEGVQVARVEQVNEKTVVILENGKEKGKSLSEVLEITRTQVQGIVKGAAPIGRWKSGDGQVFYLAVAIICDSKGNPLPGALPK